MNTDVVKAVFSSEGFPMGYYIEAIHGDGIPGGTVDITEVQWREFLDHQGRRKWANGQVVEYTPPPPALTADDCRREIQSLIDAKAQEKQYDSGATLASYINSTVPQWSAEATAFVAWRDQVWTYAMAELDKVQKGEREQPSVADFVAELPVFEWPSELVSDA